ADQGKALVLGGGKRRRREGGRQRAPLRVLLVVRFRFLRAFRGRPRPAHARHVFLPRLGAGTGRRREREPVPGAREGLRPVPGRRFVVADGGLRRKAEAGQGRPSGTAGLGGRVGRLPQRQGGAQKEERGHSCLGPQGTKAGRDIPRPATVPAFVG